MNDKPMTDFASFALTNHDTPLRAAIRAAHRRAEHDCVTPLLDAATMPSDQAANIRALAALVHEYTCG